jgi:hypothetical protein
VTNKTFDSTHQYSTNQSSRTAWDVLAERLSRAQRAQKPKLTATMKRRALKRKKTDDKSLSGPAAPGPAAPSPATPSPAAGS